MRRWVLAAALSAAVAGPVFAAKPAPAGSGANAKVSALTAAQVKQLAAARSQHLKARAALPPEQQMLLDRITDVVKAKLFAALPGGDLLTSATRLVRETIPDLDDTEAEGVAQYVLGALASGPQRDAETQMSFNRQYLQLLSQMQAVNRDYEALGEIMKTKHDAVESSISNVR
jgi:hypothetical protein